jgi:coenzyme F420-0:L-glutamate ligase/coenzyme F420-1:gamma-L-glutamate ligase
MTSPTEAFYPLILGRRSVRSFSAEPVPDDVVRRILAAAVHAPSAHNRQPWRFAVVRSGELRSRLAAAMAARFRSDLLADRLAEGDIDIQVDRARTRMVEAPVAVMVSLTMEDMDVYPDERRRLAERTMAIQSVALAGGHMLLAAHAEGLGACWVCGPLFVPEVVREGLSLPASWEPQALILIGHIERTPRVTDRRPSDEVTVWR